MIYLQPFSCVLTGGGCVFGTKLKTLKVLQGLNILLVLSLIVDKRESTNKFDRSYWTLSTTTTTTLFLCQ